MDWLAQQKEMLNEMIVSSFSLGILLIVTYYTYEKNTLFTLFGNIFIKFSIIKRDKRDLLVFASIPFAVGAFALVFRIMLM
jgi:hypothetical protein